MAHHMKDYDRSHTKNGIWYMSCAICQWLLVCQLFHTPNKLVGDWIY